MASYFQRSVVWQIMLLGTGCGDAHVVDKIRSIDDGVMISPVILLFVYNYDKKESTDALLATQTAQRLVLYW